MDNLIPCCYCSGPVKDDRLQCSSCHRTYHFRCGTGLSNVSDRTILTYLKDCGFKCSLCKIGEKNSLIHAVITINQNFNENKHATDFHPGNIIQEEAAAADVPVDLGGGDASINSRLGSTASTHSRSGSPRSIRGSVSSGHIPNGQRPRNSTTASDNFRRVLSQPEFRRVKRCKGMLYGLKNIPTSVDSLMLLDSNGRDIKAENIDGSGSKLCFRQIGGLCCAATTQALKECKPKYPKIKNLYLGLGTNDHLHSQEHPGERVDYIKSLDKEVRKVFPKASLHFILPFSAIKGLGETYVRSLAASIKDAGVRWKIHQSPAMKGKLVAPNLIHLSKEGKDIFVKWLRKICSFESPSSSGLNSSQGLPSSGLPSGSQQPQAHMSTQQPQVYMGHKQPQTHTGTLTGQPVVDSQFPTPSLRNYIHGVESTPINIDRLLKERLFELVMAPQTYTRHPNHKSRWDY